MNELVDEVKTVAILVLQLPVVTVSQEQWQRIAEILAIRLQHPVALVSSIGHRSNEDHFLSVVDWYYSQGFRRFVVMPIGLEPFDLVELHSLLIWVHTLGCKVCVHVARSWTIKDWAEAIYPSVVDALALHSPEIADSAIEIKNGMLLLANEGNRMIGPDQTVGLELASLAYQFQQENDCPDIRYAFWKDQKPSLRDVLQSWDANRVQNVVILHWRMDPDEVVTSMTQLGSLHEIAFSTDQSDFAWTWNRLSTEQPKSICFLEHPGWFHVALGIYLDALAARSIERYFVVQDQTEPERQLDPQECGIQLELRELDRKLDAMLPTEYQGRTDDVKSQSMGTASLPSNEFGNVPWDKVWTSFCDLAMAGGPPHRGTLLEAVAADEVNSNLPVYDAVVEEIGRGIEMVTGLQTRRANALGWVGIVCDNEAMAIWIMRAIIVENVMVRREGDVVFLPAGPAFRIKKEIKNVITSVAKTVHYWRAHLRLPSE